MAGVQAAGSGALAAERIVVRRCEHDHELRACVELQKEVWGFTDADLIPMRLFIVAQKIGEQVLGAFDGEELVGFALAIPGMRGGRPFLHSHMMAVRAAHRNTGVGRRIKQLQRQDALERGFELVEWTFDPLEIKNAHLNIERLGAIARRYNVNQYGTTMSPLLGGLPTDRLVAEWWLRSKRVEKLLADGTLPEYEVKERVPVPAEIYEWKASQTERGRAAQVQTVNRKALMSAFSRGLAVLGYSRDGRAGGTFLLGKWDENWSYGS